MIAFILINPVAKKGDVIKKAEYMIVLEWNHEYNDDVDLWVKDPAGNVVSFLQKSKGRYDYNGVQKKKMALLRRRAIGACIHFPLY